MHALQASPLPNECLHAPHEREVSHNSFFALVKRKTCCFGSCCVWLELPGEHFPTGGRVPPAHEQWGLFPLTAPPPGAAWGPKCARLRAAHCSSPQVTYAAPSGGPSPSPRETDSSCGQIQPPQRLPSTPQGALTCHSPCHRELQCHRGNGGSSTNSIK